MASDLANYRNPAPLVPDFLRREGGVKSISLQSGAALIGVQGRGVAVRTDIDSLISARRINELVYACIRIRANAMTDPRLMVQKRGATEWEEVDGHPFRRLMLRPNKYMDETALMKAAEVSMNVAGVFYAEKVRSGGRMVVELHPLDPSKVKEIKRKNADGTEEVTAYEWKDGRAKKTIKVEDMLVRKDWEMGDALSPLAVAMGAVDADSAQTDFIRTFFNNGGVPSGILKVNRTIQQEESDAIRAKWMQKYGRGNGQNSVAVLDENADYEKIGSSLNELSSQEIRGITESRICMTFGVPPLIVYAYVGLLRATYSNLKEAWAAFWDATMSPLLKDWRSFFQWSLLPDFENEELILSERVRLHWDLSQVAALQEDVDAIYKRAHDSFKVGGVTLNEYRAEIGKDAYPDNELGETNPYLTRLLSGGAMPTEEGETEAEAEAKSGTLPPERKKAVARRATIEAQMVKEVTDYLLEQYEEAANAVRSAE